MARAQTQNRERGDAVLTLQTGLSQWSADLDALAELSPTRSPDGAGRVRRIPRRSTDSALPVVHVVAWTLRADAAGSARWWRWQSPGVTTRAEWQQAWDRAAAWAQDGGGADGRGADVALMPLEAWQLFYFRNDAWSPAVSAEALGPNAVLPDGVRLVLSLPPGPALAGLLTRDWVRPAASVSKS
ncbi:MAG: hypothetical protein WKG52_01345 [Variovorax sp.]